MKNTTELIREQYIIDLQNYIKKTLDPKIKQGEDIDRLENGNLFKKFKKMFIKDERERIAVALTSSYTDLTEQLKITLHSKLDAIRHFQSFIENIKRERDVALQSKEDTLEYIEKLKTGEEEIPTDYIKELEAKQ